MNQIVCCCCTQIDNNFNLRSCLMDMDNIMSILNGSLQCCYCFYRWLATVCLFLSASFQLVIPNAACRCLVNSSSPCNTHTFVRCRLMWLSSFLCLFVMSCTMASSPITHTHTHLFSCGFLLRYI